MDIPSTHAEQMSTLGPDECARALEQALRQPRISQVLAKLREAHSLGINPTVCDPTEHLRGYFEVPPGDSVTLCCNFLKSKRSLAATLTHELVHAHDHHLGKFELRNISQLACSEIRAASLVDCASSWSFFKKACVQDMAISSVRVNFPYKEAKHHVEDRMRDCYIQDHTSDWAFSAPREQ
mmetsp:Transcript_28277/g.45467  ORF Transcript_28277/g.45467 Transcript_28277/m.45467 type:complete len:181 (-) Transcript_28277:40-582(-)